MPSAAETRVEELARVKINLDLQVVGKRPDGYHELDSVVVFGDLHDRLVIEPAARLRMDILGPMRDQIPIGEDNLVMRAARALAFWAKIEPRAAIRLDKHIPVAAGIGGGSADAAATLRGLAKLWQLEIDAETLYDIGNTIGADVPVCIWSKPARIRGIGERIDPVRGLPELPLLLVKPDVSLATARVFDALSWPPPPPGRQPLQPNPSPTRLAVWLGASRNDLQQAAIGQAPVIAECLTFLERISGCRLARMSGSGATCFAIFADRGESEAAAAFVRRQRPDWWAAATLAKPGT